MVQEVYQVPIEHLNVFDVCRALQQRIHLEHILPIALRIVSANGLAGGRYDGELISSLINLPAAFWTERRNEAAELRGIAKKFVFTMATTSIDDDLARDTERLRRHGIGVLERH